VNEACSGAGVGTDMRGWLIGALMLAGAGVPALAQEKPTHWTYLVEKFGTVGWEDGAVTRDAALNTVSALQVMYFYAPQRIPADATRAPGFGKPDETYDYELRIVSYACGRDAMRIVNSNMFKYVPGEMPAVAGRTPQPERRVHLGTDQTIRNHLCNGVTPEGAREAKDVGEVVRAARQAALRGN